MKIKIESEQDLINIAEEAIKIIANLRKFTKLWKETYGVELKQRKKCWEDIADKFVDSLPIEELKRNEQVKIEVDDPTGKSN